MHVSFIIKKKRKKKELKIKRELKTKVKYTIWNKNNEENQSRTHYKELLNKTLIFSFIIAIATAPSYQFSGTPSLGDMAFLKNRF